MRNIEISEIIGNINDKYIDEAILYTGKEKSIRHNKPEKWGVAIAACLCIVVIVTFRDSEADNTELQGQIPTTQEEIDTSPVYYII